MNENKIHKHLPTISFGYNFEVEHHSENRKANYELAVYYLENEESESQQKHTVILENVTIVEFIGGNKKSLVVISNDLIYQYIGSKMKEGKFYWYFYLKEDSHYVKLLDNIWVTEEQYQQLEKQFEKLDFAIEKDVNLIMREYSGSFPASIEPLPIIPPSQLQDRLW